MQPTVTKRLLTPLTALALLTLCWTMPALAEEEKSVSRTFSATSGQTLDLENLAGKVVIEGGGGDIRVEAIIHAENQKLLNSLDLRFEEGANLVVRADYPENYSTFYYPGGNGWNGSTSTKYQGRRVKVVSRDTSKAVGLWVDFRIQVPTGVNVKVKNSAGSVEAQEVGGGLNIDTGSGAITISGGSGNVMADTGSGSVDVSNRVGDVNADTGSGSVTITAVTGNVNADTGSGSVRLTDVEGEGILADTGSGSVILTNVRGAINADTGSGSVKGEDLAPRGQLRVDTGSGGIRLAGDFTQVEGFELDAGSGSVSLTGALPGLDLEVSTGSGGIDVDIPGLEVLSKSRDELRARSGGGGVPARFDTGSGSVKIREQ